MDKHSTDNLDPDQPDSGSSNQSEFDLEKLDLDNLNLEESEESIVQESKIQGSNVPVVPINKEPVKSLFVPLRLNPSRLGLNKPSRGRDELDPDDLEEDATVYDQLETVEILSQEFIQAIRDGHSPSIEDYADEYPQLATQIRDLFPIILQMESARDRSLVRRNDGRVLASPQPIKQLGDFKIIREIGRGGMGIVYEAVQQSLARQVAVKILPRTEFDSKTEQFAIESRLGANLHHTNIVPIYGVGQQDGVNYYVMQLIRGQPLSKFIRLDNERKSTQLSLNQICEIGIQAASAIDYAHQQGTLHRDIKPANLILDPQGNVWVTDFGLAISESKAADELPKKSEVPGTLHYLPPEKLLGQPDSPRGDIYSLGLTLTELIAGKPAFKLTNKTHLTEQIETGSIDGLNELHRKLPTDLFAVLMKSIATDPKQRYASGGELAEDLRRYLEDLPVSCHAPSMLVSLRRWIKKNPALAAMSAFAVMLLLMISFVSTTGYFRIQYVLNAETTQRKRAQTAAIVASTSLEKVFRQLAPETQFAEDNSNFNQPILSDETASLLADLVASQERLAGGEFEDPLLVFQTLLAQCRVGEINERLGNYEAARNIYSKALEKFEQMPDSNKYYLVVAKLNNRLASVSRTMGNDEMAIEYCQNTISLLATISPRNRDITALQLEQARALYFQSQDVRPGFGIYQLPPIWFSLSPDSEVIAPAIRPDKDLLSQAIAILENLLESRPANEASIEHLLAACYREIADDDLGARNDADETHEQQSIELLEDLVEEFPKKSTYQFELMQAHAEINIFERDLDLDTLRKAQAALNEAIPLGQSLVENRPDIPRFRSGLVHAYFKLATISERIANLLEGGDQLALQEEAKRLYEQAVVGQEYLLRQHPDLAGYKAWLARFQLSLARCPDVADQEQLVGDALSLLFGLPEELQAEPEIKHLILEANGRVLVQSKETKE